MLHCTLQMFNSIKHKRSQSFYEESISTTASDTWHYCQHCHVGFSSESRYGWHLEICKQKGFPKQA
ncbi:hypothetical protein BCV71DRAFT_101397 [Rhizopus microsporus]|uniref:Uncharacterized protein n=1 Tax=Rhizopus microsporus TaxID=58291 RepID=A0A1X0S576_RHIZD|nr:hypothetical protein BCV71DRAFT_101397 [Rhizopus microsporus]